MEYWRMCCWVILMDGIKNKYIKEKYRSIIIDMNERARERERESPHFLDLTRSFGITRNLDTTIYYVYFI